MLGSRQTLAGLSPSAKKAPPRPLKQLVDFDTCSSFVHEFPHSLRAEREPDLESLRNEEMENFIDHLLAMPDTGEDVDFDRPR